MTNATEPEAAQPQPCIPCAEKPARVPRAPIAGVLPADSLAHELLSNPVQQGGAVGTLTNHGGRVIASPRVVNVYLDAFGGNAADFDAFTKAIVEDGYLDATTEFGGGRGTFLGSFRVAAGMSGTVTDAQLQALLHRLLELGTLPAADANTAYALIMPPTLQVQAADGSRSCQAFCGYHGKSTRGIYYWITCDPGCAGCHGNFAPEQGRMMVHGHELGEWVTDPDLNAWYNDQTGAENGDECAWQLVQWGPAGSGWAVQPLATNSQGCLTTPYQAPQPTPQPQPQPQPVGVTVSGTAHAQTGQPLSYEATVTGGTPPYAVTWALDGTPKPGVAMAVSFSSLPVGTHTIAASTQGASGQTRVVITPNAPPPTPTCHDRALALMDRQLASLGSDAWGKTGVTWGGWFRSGLDRGLATAGMGTASDPGDGQDLPMPPEPPEPPTDDPRPAPVRHRYSRGEVALFATVGVFALQGLAALLGAAVTGQLQVTPQAAEVLAVLDPALTGLIAFLISRLQTEES